MVNFPLKAFIMGFMSTFGVHIIDNTYFSKNLKMLKKILTDKFKDDILKTTNVLKHKMKGGK